MTPREKFFAALERRPITGRVPHFELVFFLTMEAFGKVHPTHRHFSQWDQMSAEEQTLQIEDVADLYVKIAERYAGAVRYINDFDDENLAVVELQPLVAPEFLFEKRER